MKEINIETLKTAAHKQMFEMSEEQYKKLLDEYDVIVSQMKLISEIDGVDEAEPMTFPFEVSNSFLREDASFNPIPREEMLKNTKDVSNGQVKIHRVVK